MSAVSYSPFVKSEDLVMYDMPKELNVNEASKTLCSLSSKIKMFIRELRYNGPFVALGYFLPKKEDKIIARRCQFGHKKLSVYEPQSNFEQKTKSYVIVLGAEKNRKNESSCIYFVFSRVSATDWDSSLRTHNVANACLFVNTLEEFVYRTIEHYPATSEEDNVVLPVSEPHCPKLSDKRLEYVYMFSNVMPLGLLSDTNKKNNYILKEIGQLIFNELKKNANDDSAKAKKDLLDICLAISFYAKDGFARVNALQHIWKGVGDKNCTFAADDQEKAI